MKQFLGLMSMLGLLVLACPFQLSADTPTKATVITLEADAKSQKEINKLCAEKAVPELNRTFPSAKNGRWTGEGSSSYSYTYCQVEYTTDEPLEFLVLKMDDRSVRTQKDADKVCGKDALKTVKGMDAQAKNIKWTGAWNSFNNYQDVICYMEYSK